MRLLGSSWAGGAWLKALKAAERERVLFIGTPFSNLYTLVYAPAIGRVVVCLVFVIACKYALGHSEVSQPLNLLLIMPPLTLWFFHFASCLPSLQQTPLQLSQAPLPLHLPPPCGPIPSTYPPRLDFYYVHLQ